MPGTFQLQMYQLSFCHFCCCCSLKLSQLVVSLPQWVFCALSQKNGGILAARCTTAGLLVDLMLTVLNGMRWDITSFIDDDSTRS